MEPLFVYFGQQVLNLFFFPYLYDLKGIIQSISREIMLFLPPFFHVKYYFIIFLPPFVVEACNFAQEFHKRNDKNGILPSPLTSPTPNPRTSPHPFKNTKFSYTKLPSSPFVSPSICQTEFGQRKDKRERADKGEI